MAYFPVYKIVASTCHMKVFAIVICIVTVQSFQNRHYHSPLCCTSPIVHLVCPPNVCIGIVFSSSWDDCNNQEKWKTKVMQNFGRQTRCILGHMQMMNRADTFLRHIWLAELRAKYCTPSLSVSCLSIVRNPSKITQTANIDWECSLCTALVPYLV